MEKISLDLANYPKEKPLKTDECTKTYLSLCKETGKNVLVMEFHNLDSKLEDDLILFTNNVDIIRKCINSFLPRFIGFSLVNYDNLRHPCLVFDYYPHNLQEKIGSNDISMFSPGINFHKIQLLYEIIIVMEYLHGRKICHRRLSLETTLLDENGFPFLSQFGLTFLPAKTTAPESAQNYSYKTDVWQFGLIMFEVITNQKPIFDSEGKISYNDEFVIPEDLKAVINSCLASKTEERPTFTEIRDKFENDLIIDLPNFFEKQKLNEFNDLAKKSFPKTKIPILKLDNSNNSEITIHYLNQAAEIIKIRPTCRVRHLIKRLEQKHNIQFSDGYILTAYGVTLQPDEVLMRWQVKDVSVSQDGIYIKIMDDNHKTKIGVLKTDTIFSLKHKIMERWGMRDHPIELTLDGKKLENGTKIAESGIVPHSHITLVASIFGD